MTSRNFPDWITAFCNYASYGEAPRYMYEWVAVSTIAGALRRKVWIDQFYFRWYPNFYVVLVAPPGIVSKSTTAGIGMDLLKQVPGIRFGPSVVTWQALVTSFAEAAESFELNGEWQTMSPITIESSEFGNLLNPADKDMVDMLVNLWDGKSFAKRTKTSGSDEVVNPWINLIACTTPSWIAGNFPEYMIGGGFTSRCVFVYAEEKHKYNAYPGLSVPAGATETARQLIRDLEHISLALTGPYHLSPDAIAWGERWYTEHYQNPNPALDEDRFGGYHARKQTHIHKLAIVIAASQRDSQVIEVSDLVRANAMVTALEPQMSQVFARIGASEEAYHAIRLITLVQRHGPISVADAYRRVHAQFPKGADFQEIINGAVKSRQIDLRQEGTEFVLCPVRS